MPAAGWKDRRAAWAGLLSRCCPGRRNSPRGNALLDAELLATPPTDDAPAGAPRLSSSPSPSGKGIAWLRRARDTVARRLAKLRRKKENTSGSAPTDPEREPVLHQQESSASLYSTQPSLLSQVPEPPPLVLLQTSSFQPDANSKESIAQLHYEIATLQAKLQQSAVVAKQQHEEVAVLRAKLQHAAHNEDTARQRALRAELRGLSHNEAWTRLCMQTEADKEWETLMSACHTLGTSSTEGAATVHEPADALVVRGHVPRTRSGAAELTLPEPTSARSRTHARDCLFIDVICHWVASFVHRDWARVCSRTADAVYRALIERHAVWHSTALLVGEFQSAGAAQPTDLMTFGPEPGPLAAAGSSVRSLGKMVSSTYTPDLRARDRFVIHMLQIRTIYEDLRLNHTQAFITASGLATDMNDVLLTLEETLEMYRTRKAAAGGNTTPSPAVAAH